LRRLRYPTDLRERVVRIVRFHMLDIGKADDVRARRLLARYGEGLALDLLDHKEADLVGKEVTGRREQELERLRAFRRLVEQERVHPHHLSDLAVDGTDLIEVGYRPGPDLGRTLGELLRIVVEDPALNRRETLLERAKELLPE
jgi:tRNA nucleotidyltransferase (CCA-adding enzyme)